MAYRKYFLVCILFGLIGGLWAEEIPKLKFWLLDEIEYLSKSQGDMEIKAKDISLKAFPPGIKFRKITLTPKNNLAKILTATQLEALSVYLNIEALLSGRFEIEKIILDKPSGHVTLATPTKEENGIKGKVLFDWNDFIGIPVHSLIFNQAEILLNLKDEGYKIQTKNLMIRLEKNFRAAKIEIIAPDIVVQPPNQPEKPIALGFMTRVIVEKQALELAALKLAFAKNFVIARGVGRGDVTRMQLPILNGRMITESQIAEIEALAKQIFPNLKIPQISGFVRTDFSAQAENGKDVKVTSFIKTENIKADKFMIGDIVGTFEYAKGTVKAQKILLHNSSGNARLENFSIVNNAEKKLSAKVIFDGVELRHFLDNIDVTNVPLHMDIKGEVPCEGTLTPLRVDCAGELSGSSFNLWSENYAPLPNGKDDLSKPLGKRTIVALDDFSAVSQLGIDKDHIWFPKALLRIGKSTGTANGEVSFEKGFSFAYHTDKLDFNDVRNLAELKFQGTVGLNGTTQGNGHSGIIDVQASTPEFYFENYGLGNANLHLRYEKGLISLTDFRGVAGNLEYNGNVIVRVGSEGGKRPGVESAHVDIPKLDLADLQNKTFGKKVTLPFSSQGAGSAVVDASGPFALSELNYTLKSTVNHVVVAGETFEQARFNVHGINGHAYADDVYLKKGHGGFRWVGDVEPSGSMTVNIRGEDLRITDFEGVHIFAANLDGHLSTDIQLRNHILLPKVSIHGVATQMSLNQQALGDSDFDIIFSAAGFNLNGQFFNKKLSTQVQYPFKPNEPFAFKLKADAWDFSSLLSFLSKTPRRDYETSITARVDIEDKNGSFWNSYGSAQFTNLYIRHGNSQMKSTRPLLVKFEEGLITVPPTHIEGDDTQLTFMGTKSKKDNLNFNINGKIDLSLLTFLTPFLRDMGGQLSISTQIAGTLQKIDLLGSAFIKNGYFKLDALPQPFENISADMLFSQTRVLINRLQGRLAGGDLSGSGVIRFHEFGDIPVELTGDLLHPGLTIPEGLLTHGDFHFGITGSWFPYLLRGDYVIANGLYTKNFTANINDNNLKRSIYLPKLVLQKDFVPLEVDLKTHFPKGVMVKNSMMDAEVKGDLTITGDPTHPILKGDLTATPGGKIFFSETPFTIIDTKVGFNNPTENNPNLYIQANSRVRDWDVTLLVQGTMQKPNLQLSSSPPLPQKSIVSLLALGVTEEDENKIQQNLVTPNSLSSISSAQNQGQIQSYEAGSLLLQDNPVKNELKKRFGVNVRLSPTVDARNTVLPRVIAEKQWSPRISTSVSRTVGDFVTQNAVVEYKLNRYFSVLGSFEQRDYDPYAPPNSTGASAQSTNILGLDLQYQVEFK